MIFRKLFLVLAVVAGLCSFDAPIENPRLPQVAQTELVVSGRHQKEVLVSKDFSEHRLFFVHDQAIPSPQHHRYYQALLIESQHHHSSL